MNLNNLAAAFNTRSHATAMWRTHLLFPAGGKIAPMGSGIWDGSLNYSSELDIEQEETTEGQNPLDKKGGELAKEFSIRVQVNKIADGTSPLATYKKWQDSLGKKGYFFIGGAPIDNSMYILKRVEISFSNVDIAADGSPYRADIMLSFVEDVVQKKVDAEIKEQAAAGDTKKTVSKAAKKAEKQTATWDIKKGKWSDE